MAVTKYRLPVLVLLCALLCFACACAAAENYTVEDDGSKWYDDGRIEWPDGSVTYSVDHDQGQSYDDDDSGSSSGSGTIKCICASTTYFHLLYTGNGNIFYVCIITKGSI